MQIIVQPVFPPIPTTAFDWCAYIDGMEELPHLYGHGRTKEDAVKELRFNLEDQGEHFLFDFDQAQVA
jgi:hypothetical protein